MSPDEIGIVCEAIKETVNAIPGYRCEYQSWGSSRDIPKKWPVQIEVHCELEREDGHKKEGVIAIIAWHNQHFFRIYDPNGMHTSPENIALELKIMQKKWANWTSYQNNSQDWLPAVEIKLADPNWKSTFEKALPDFRAKAASRKGRGGKKKRRKNRLKWR